MQKRREIADEHERTFLSVYSINANPDSADEKSDPKSDNVQEQANQKNMFKSNILDNENDDMLPQYGNIRDRPCSIKPEYYVTMHKLKSELHLSENQQQGAICTLANNIFGRRE